MEATHISMLAYLDETNISSEKNRKKKNLSCPLPFRKADAAGIGCLSAFCFIHATTSRDCMEELGGSWGVD